MNTPARSRAATVAALMLVLSGGLMAGCGGGSSSGGPQDAFIGRWFQESPNPTDPTATGFTLNCTDPNFPDFAGTHALLVWPTLIFEHGTLTDLAETSGNCSPLNYDVMGKSATVPHPDPYLDSDPGCVIPFTIPNPAMAGATLQAIVILTPAEGAMWSFMLLDTKGTGGVPQARLTGSATGHLAAQDGMGGVIESNPDCTYAGMDTYFRLTQP